MNTTISSFSIKKAINFIILLLIGFLSFFNIGANVTNALGWDAEEIIYCQDDSCGLKEGIELVKDSGIDGVETDGKASDKIQDVVIYLLGFITLIAVIYIIYAGFRILTSSGDDEVIKNSKKIIIYVIIGILVIWFAWTIANFATTIGTGGK